MTDVLIVEDDVDNRETMRMALELEDARYHIFEADRGDEALRFLQRHTGPMVVLLDHFMPHLTGAELLKLVAEDHSLLQRHAYINLTAAPPQVFSPDFLALLASMHIPVVSKPFDLDTLLDVVEEQAARLQRGGLPSHPVSASSGNTGEANA